MLVKFLRIDVSIWVLIELVDYLRELAQVSLKFSVCVSIFFRSVEIELNETLIQIPKL